MYLAVEAIHLGKTLFSISVLSENPKPVINVPFLRLNGLSLPIGV